jgi:hypothetical protein
MRLLARLRLNGAHVELELHGALAHTVRLLHDGLTTTEINQDLLAIHTNERVGSIMLYDWASVGRPSFLLLAAPLGADKPSEGSDTDPGASAPGGCCRQSEHHAACC